MKPIVKIAAAGAAVLGLVFLGTKSASAATPTPVPPEPPQPPTPPPGPGPFVRPKQPPNPPAGSTLALVVPACGPTDAPDCSLGLLVHTAPDTDPSTRVAPKGNAPDSLHALTGDLVAIIDDGYADQSTPPTTRKWAKIMTPMGNIGFVSSVDPQGRSNFQPAPPSTGAVRRGAGSPGYATGNPVYVRCVAPSGCTIRSYVFGHAVNTIAENGAILQFLKSDAASGTSYVRYYDRARRSYVDGWAPTAWLR
jgi:hypothetical protein